MSIRLWLMVADCWVCGASIELTEEQEQEALRLLEEQQATEEAPAPEPKTEQTSPTPKPAPPSKKPQAAPKKKRRRVTEKKVPVAKKPPAKKTAKKSDKRPFFGKRDPQVERTGIPAALKPSRVRQHLKDVHSLGEVRLWFRDVFRDLPAWLISAVVNLLILLILAMLFIDQYRDGPRELILSTNVSTEDAPGDLDGGDEPDPVEFDTTGTDEPADAVVPEPEPPMDAFNKPPIDPGELLGDRSRPDPPPDRGVNPGIATGAHILKGRDPSARAQRVLREGGTIASEAAVARGLIWLAKHQNANGSWSLDEFDHAGDCDERCADTGGHSNTAGTALALLPFLGAGQTHLAGQYRAEVKAGLEWLIRAQESDGDLRGRGIGNMYAHAQCAIVLCEAFALTRDESLREPAQKAIDFIVDAQHHRGGWRYSPGSPGDTSVVGWQLMALRSAQMAYLNVPTSAFEKANNFLDDVEHRRRDGQYSYQPGGRPTAAMTAEALLCRQYYGWPRSHKGLLAGCNELLDEHMPRKRTLNIYYVYYATQVMHHMQGDYFTEWNDTVRDMLVDLQETRGHQAGSWTPIRGARFRDSSGGRLYWTSLSICCLEVYYRHMPLYESHAVGDE